MAPDRCSVWLNEDIRIRSGSVPDRFTGNWSDRPEMCAINADRTRTGGKPVVAPRKEEQSWLSLRAGRRCRPCFMTWTSGGGAAAESVRPL